MVSLAERVLVVLPGAMLERTRDAIQFDWGGEQGIVLLVGPEALELRLPTVEWTKGAYGPARSSRLWFEDGDMFAVTVPLAESRGKDQD